MKQNSLEERMSKLEETHSNNNTGSDRLFEQVRELFYFIIYIK